MKVTRWNSEKHVEEEVESIGKVTFVGFARGYDLTDGVTYDCIGIRNQLMVLIDDSKDYYLYLPQDGNRIINKEADGAGFIIEEDPTGQLQALFELQHQSILKQRKKLVSRLMQFVINRNQKIKQYDQRK